MTELEGIILRNFTMQDLRGRSAIGQAHRLANHLRVAARPTVVRRLLRLIDLGMLAERDGGYALTPAGRAWIASNPGPVRAPWAQVHMDG